ncbi:MAG TPA: M1 family metallopeptidase [Gemmatimonadaceae bacterium]|nr:M1 family metallopeptidase [Gemmatimonadaceae bacterium]
MRTLIVGLVVAGLSACAPSPSLSPTPQLGASIASPLPMPRGVQAAYRKGTRSPDGRPGPNYWQNRGRYFIAITATPPDRTIRGSEEITYFNNSPDTLANPVFKFFMNIHKPGAPRAFGASANYLSSGVVIDTLLVNNQPTPWPNAAAGFTNVRLRLPTPVRPRDSVHFTIRWHYDIAKEPGREGMIDSTTWYLAYFYPRVAVFDDYNGWDTMEFTDLQEFYSDFNDYNVAITVPRNFVVWGTGTLLNPAEVLQPAIAQRLNQSMTSDQTITIASKEDMRAHRVTAQSARNTWRFRASDIPDMAFNLSDHYVWDGASVVVDDATKRRASVQAAYNDTAADFHQMVRYGQHALGWLSRNWPGVPYPYEKSTIVQGGAGMEYPMMVNDEAYTDTVFSRFVAEHEIAHTYFPFYMGINETRYAFMDEGWATTFEYLIGIADLGLDTASRFYKQFRTSGWANSQSPLEDLPIITPADALSLFAYGDNAYGKPALGYLALKDMLGDAMFRNVLHEFMNRWHSKHPIPWDFFNTVNNVSGQNLNWFWSAWYFSPGYIDLAIAGVDKTSDGYNVRISNIGGMPAPVDLEARYSDGTSQTYHQSAAMWAANLRSTVAPIATRKTVQSVTLNTGVFVDADSTNNVWRAGAR